MRISKDPDVRKRELLRAAEELFRDNSYEKTSVSDIVKKVGVAQGTFYYYFKSKDDVLNAVIDHYIDMYVAGLERLLSNDQIDPMSKIEMVVNDGLSMHICDRKFVEFLHAEENLVTHQRYMMKSFDEVIPIITKIVEQGVTAGIFNVENPKEVVEIMVFAFGYLEDALFLSSGDEQYFRRLRAAEQLTERALGIPKGSIHIDPSTASNISSEDYYREF
ncbi:MAG TPA: TetR/AcrR family transcriptional regulator [Methanocella sp.]|nr:TetR/AcrR family transcriptional regulator [Methanocella sp.]